MNRMLLRITIACVEQICMTNSYLSKFCLYRTIVQPYSGIKYYFEIVFSNFSSSSLAFLSSSSSVICSTDTTCKNEESNWIYSFSFLSTTYFRDVKLEHILDAALQRDHGAGTTCTRALHFQINDAVFERLKDDITTVFLDSWPDSCV